MTKKKPGWFGKTPAQMTRWERWWWERCIHRSHRWGLRCWRTFVYSHLCYKHHGYKHYDKSCPYY